MSDLLIGIAGIVVGIVFKYFFDKWNSPYVTRAEFEKMEAELRAIRCVLIKLAVKMGVNVDDLRHIVQ